MKIGTLILCFQLIVTATASIAQALQPLKVNRNYRYLETQDGNPFLWTGDTSWGMAEFLTREEIDTYLDNRKEKGINVIQICLFWGKRKENPLSFTVNPPNAYGYKAFKHTRNQADPSLPDTVTGGSPQAPNDYWDHVEYIFQATAERGIYIAVLPIWGRRYVNASHKGHSQQVFDDKNAFVYGRFLGNRYKKYTHTIWMMGGDVNATDNGDFRHIYRRMAEGLANGVTGRQLYWDKQDKAWDEVMMTYHPNGAPFHNSSEWFHNDPWLDFNMIQTFIHKEDVYDAVLKDYYLENPVKPTVLGEPEYEGFYGEYVIQGADMRRQMYQTFFAGGAGFTYGAFSDSLNRGPLFSPSNGWQHLLNLEGVNSINLLRNFLIKHKWHHWVPDTSVVKKENGKMTPSAVIHKNLQRLFVYFPENKTEILSLPPFFHSANMSVEWYNPKTGETIMGNVPRGPNILVFTPPDHMEDAVLVLSMAL